MPNLILFDDDVREHLLPLTFTRPVCEIRIGILTIKEKWQRRLNASISYITQDYLINKYPIVIENDNYVINGSVLPSPELVELVKQLEINEALLENGELIAARLNEEQFDRLIDNDEIDELTGYEINDTPYLRIKQLWDIFKLNGQAIKEDFDFLTKNRKSKHISKTNRLINPKNLFVEEGAKIECAILNATDGPIYIGKDAEVMEGAIVRGALALCEGAKLKMGTKIYGATTIGPHSKVGGEVGNSIVIGYSNKGHDGYMGNSILGEWCNLGADTNTSNLKNNYSEVKLWNYTAERFLPTGQTFCGLVMGDHSKCGINTMFNTGTVVGVSANIFGGGYPRNFVPSFSWGGAQGLSTYKTEKAFEVAEVVMKRRNKEFTETEKNILNKVFEDTSKHRRWEKKVES